MSALALPIPVSGGSTTDSPEDPASDRRRVINNEGGPDRRKVVHRGTSPRADGSEDGPPPDGLDRRKIIHRSPSAGGGTGGSEDGPAPDPVTDRRKPIHQRPTAQTDDPPNPHDPPSRGPSHGSVSSVLMAEAADPPGSSDPPERGADGDNRPVGGEPAARRALAESLGGIQATDREARSAVGTRLVGTARALAATLMLLAMLGSVVGGALPVHTDGHDALAETSAHVDVQEADVATGLFSLWALAVSGWNALAGDDICGDCNLPADDGCKCVCTSGGGACPGLRSGDPDDPACQF